MLDAAQILSAKEQIEILLKEYDTLRAEIIARTTGGYQVISIGAVLFTALLTVVATRTHPAGEVGTKLLRSTLFWVALGALVVFAGVSMSFTYRDINLIAGRIQQIEQKVNRLAGVDLLEWESKWGGSKTGWFLREHVTSDPKPNRPPTH